MIKLSRVLVYASFLSLPGAEEHGFLAVSATYIAIAFVSPVLALAINQSAITKNNKIFKTRDLIYISLIILLSIINYQIAVHNNIENLIWLARGIHILAIPSIYLCMRIENTERNTIFKDICIAGALEIGLIYFAALYYQADEYRRAADIEGVILYSIFSLCSAQYCIEKYLKSEKKLWILLYIAVLTAATLTGTRIFTASILILGIQLKKKEKIMIGILASAAIIITLTSLNANNPIQRLNFENEENIITISAKIEEVDILYQYFKENPIFGSGFAKPYQISIANSEYTYSHNIIMFYLGYSGILGLLFFTYPLTREAKNRKSLIFIFSVVIFYTSSTTYTNLKHSIFLSTLLLPMTRKERFITTIINGKSKHQ